MERVWGREESLAYTRWLATHHYENFHVVSFLLPKDLHQDFYNVYSFCRWADDLGDEIGDTAESLRLLEWWRDLTDRMYAGEASHPVFVALGETAKRHDLPPEPFLDLIRAFVSDQTVTRYQTWEELFGYCRYSANPVGRLVLYLCGYRDAERQALSDKTCTALQLANFWQDVTVDLLKQRIYIPMEALDRHGSSEEEVVQLRFTPAFRAAMAEAVEAARKLFLEGLPLARMVNRRLSLDLELFSRGGLKILDKIVSNNYDVLSARPATLAESYTHCRETTRARAKNFYYAFRLLDPKRRDSICSIYAFMRHCDDLSDEPGATIESLEQWRAKLDHPDDNPLWPAFFDTVEHYRIPRQYFHDMIDGVSSDLTRTEFETFDELYRYCYNVASVAGLSLIHIFGFNNPGAPKLAEKCGIAFQLTNIIRDVKEDESLGRCYLPREDRRRFPEIREVLRFEAQRARAYYEESRPLLGMVDPKTRPSLAALIEIYSRLLDRIEERDFDVFSERIRLSTAEKLLILGKAWISS